MIPPGALGSAALIANRRSGAWIKGMRFDFAASIAMENPERRLGGGRREFAYIRSRHATNFAVGRRHNRRWMSGTDHLC